MNMHTNVPLNKQTLGVLSDLDVIDQCLRPDGQFLIDAGCGNMHLSKALAKRGAHVLAIDPDPIQAEKNRAADIVANVGFAETGADHIPVENQSVHGVLFPYSLHHVPATLYEAVFAEVLRVLKPEGFVYIMEPVASGDLNEVTRLFHEEGPVREAAQSAIETLAIPLFSQVDVIEYSTRIKYDSWEHFASRYVGKSFNTNYSEAQVRADNVRDKFQEVGAHRNFEFESPMRVTWLQKPVSTLLS